MGCNPQVELICHSERISVGSRGLALVARMRPVYPPGLPSVSDRGGYGTGPASRPSRLSRSDRIACTRSVTRRRDRTAALQPATGMAVSQLLELNHCKNYDLFRRSPRCRLPESPNLPDFRKRLKLGETPGCNIIPSRNNVLPSPPGVLVDFWRVAGRAKNLGDFRLMRALHEGPDAWKMGPFF
jgi:hypothetical protein